MRRTRRFPRFASIDSSDDVPAIVKYVDDRHAVVEHRLGAQHPNARRARERLEARGFIIVEPTPPAAIDVDTSANP
jgi:hypothetical protein